jgi:hypothetical protein
MLLRNKIIFVWLFTATVATAQPDPATFLHPPASARPWVFWYWMQAAVSKEGIQADLKAMKDAGIGGAYLMPINGAAKPPIYTPVVEQLSPLWWEMVRYAMQQADSLGLQLAMHACDGFAVAGGPWITPELSMQKVVWTRTGVDGGAQREIILPQPETNVGYYRDIAVLAFPTPAAWEMSTRTVVPRVTTSTGINAQYLVEGGKESFKSDEPCWIQYAFDRPFTCRSIIIHAINNYQAQRLIVETSMDGIHFRRVTRLVPPRHGWEDGDADVTHSIAAVTTRYFRFIYNKEGAEPGAEDLDAAKWKPSLKVSGIQLSAAPAIDQFEGKNGEIWRVSRPTGVGQSPNSLCIDPRAIVDLSAKMDSAGHLVWRVPAGHWTILRVGHTSTGHTNATGGGGKGLESDKFDARVTEMQFDRWFGEAIRQAGPELAERVLRLFHVDSWECGSQNWSPVFREEFRRRRGYDLLRWLPAMAGIPIATADSSERFLHDIRQTISELVNDAFYVPMARMAHAKGCVFSAESVAPTMTSDGILHFAQADIPMGEFWLRSPTHDKPNDMLDAISGAHVYGKPLVQAEAFTELRLSWDEYPGMLKTVQDRNYALGINRMVLHVFTHNPWLDRKPGMTLGGVGNFFQRDQTWWAQSKAWIDYTQRCQWLLQQGTPVADIAVFTGEELPRRAVLPERLVRVLPGLFGVQRVKSEAVRLQNAGAPTTKWPSGVVHSANMADPADWTDPLHGYAFDSFNPDVLLRLARVRDGRVVLPGGASYALLVWPGASGMTPDPGAVSAAVAQRLLQLVRDGATLVIDPVAGYHSTGMLNSARDNQIVRDVFRQLKAGGRVGMGRVFVGPFSDSTLDGIGVQRDFISGTTGVAYTHRTEPGLDIYFISNQLDKAKLLHASVRVSGRQPELWDPVTGQSEPLSKWSVKGGRSFFDLNLRPGGSVFVVFRRAAAPPVITKILEETGMLESTHTIPGPWTVQFDTAFGGPLTTVRFDSLMDWSKHPDSSIRYYSGTATYRNVFEADKSGRPVYLDLGRVANIATVYVNDIDCGTVWTANGLDITKAIRNGANQLRIAVTNTWANRLTGDQRLPENKRRTWTTSPWHSDGSLLPAGLLGPVYIRY